MSAAISCSRTWPASASPDIPIAARATALSSEHGRQESIQPRPIPVAGPSQLSNVGYGSWPTEAAAVVELATQHYQGANHTNW